MFALFASEDVMVTRWAESGIATSEMARSGQGAALQFQLQCKYRNGAIRVQRAVADTFDAAGCGVCRADARSMQLNVIRGCANPRQEMV